MKRFFSLPIFCIIAFLFTTTSCSEHWGLEKKHNEVDRGVLLYFSGNNNLTSYLKNNLNTICSTTSIPNQYCDTVLMVFSHFVGETPTLRRYYKTTNGDVIGELIAAYDNDFNSGDKDCFAMVEKDAFSKYPAKSKGLLISSHGSAWLPEGYYNNPKDLEQRSLSQYQRDRFSTIDITKLSLNSLDSKSIGFDRDSEINITDLAKALQYHYEYICFDACFMSSIEVAYELRKKTDYIIGSTCEVIAEGFPYSAIFDNLMMGGEKLLTICSETLVANNLTFSEGAISLIKCTNLEPLAQYCKELYSIHKDQLGLVNPKTIQAYFRYTDEWFYDFENYIASFSTDSEYLGFKNLLEDVVIAKNNTPKLFKLRLEKHSGLSIYIPMARYSTLNSYYKTLEWYKATSTPE